MSSSASSPSSAFTASSTSISIPLPPYSLDLIDKLIKQWKINETSLEIQTVNRVTMEHINKYIESSEADMQTDDWIEIIRKEVSDKNIYLNLLFKLTKRLEEEQINIL